MIAVGVHSAAYHARTSRIKGGPVIRRCDVLATRYDFILAPMLTLGFHARLAAFYRFGGFLMTIASLKSKAVGDVLAANNVQTRLGEEGRMIGRILHLESSGTHRLPGCRADWPSLEPLCTGNCSIGFQRNLRALPSVAGRFFG